jgi:hypothetical protein
MEITIDERAREAATAVHNAATAACRQAAALPREARGRRIHAGRRACCRRRDWRAASETPLGGRASRRLARQLRMHHSRATPEERGRS